MMRASFVGLTLLAGLLPTVMARSAEPVEFTARSEQYFAARVEQLAREDAAALDAVTAENWEETRQRWRGQLQEQLGLAPWPARGDLQATVTGAFEHDGVQIRRLHFQSSPGLYVTANLYLPDQPKPPADGWPVVLYVCGHARVTDHGRLLGNKTGYHHHGLWFARNGTACLTIDTTQLGELHGEHHGTYRYGRWDWISRGFTPAGVEAWNSIRAIDYLETLPEIDATRIGVTGRSGGGAYSWFVAAMDDRIDAAVPVAGITDLQNHVVDGCVEGHCDCMYPVNYHGWDYMRLAALVAPRPLMLANSDQDGIFPLDGVVRVHRSLERLYDKLDARDDYGLLITPGPHRDTQELQVGAFRWLLKALTDKEPVVDRAATKELQPEQLLVFENEIPRDERVTSVSGWFVPAADDVADPQAAARQWDQKWAQRLRETTLRSWFPLDTTPPTATTLLHGQTGRWRWTAEQLASADAAASLPAGMLRVEADDNDKPAGVIIHMGLSDALQLNEATIEAVLARPRVQAILNGSADHVHVFAVPRESGWNRAGVSATEQTHRLRRYYLLGETAETGQTLDALRVMMRLDAQRADAKDHDLPNSWTVAGYGRAAPLAALAALSWQQWMPSTATQVQRLAVHDYPLDPMQAPVMPGWLRICSPAGLLAAARGKLPEVQEVADRPQAKRPEPAETLSVDPLDPQAGPHQATGMRITEVTSDRAVVWARTTRWALPNMSDLPEVRFTKSAPGKRDSGVVLPPDGVAGLRHAVPGADGQVRVRYRGDGPQWRTTDWRTVDPAADHSALIELTDLQPATTYQVTVEARGSDSDRVTSSQRGSFKTLPAADAHVPFRLAIGTCQSFVDRDGPHGFDLYRTLQDRNVDAFVLAGDVVYYDALARSVDLANYHWQRTYSLPTLVDFHRSVPTYFLKDDHDTYVNDSWPGKHFDWTEAFTFVDGQRIFRQQTGLPEPAYRTLRIGRDLQVWMMEGRDYRDANNAPDGEQKSIWGDKQWQWLQQTMADSTAKFRIIISPTPLVGPDRDNKADNHANRAFAAEGQRVRAFLASQPNTVAVCGDRHWQYHSVDPQTGLHEFSVGPVSDRHAGGWKQEDFRPQIHRFLRVGGGYLEIELEPHGDQATLVLTHRDVQGQPQHTYKLE